MILEICQKKFDTKDIRDIMIKEGTIFVDAADDFHRLTYTTEDEIKEAQNWIDFKKLTESKLTDAVKIIIMVCEHYANQYRQCEECPLQREYGCIIQAPVNWQR